MLEQLMEFKLKGERNYIHGTDIYNQTITKLMTTEGEIEDIDFSFHRIATHQLKVLLNTPQEGMEPVAVLTFTSHGSRNKAYLIETENKVEERYPYPEDEIVAQISFDTTRRQCTLSGESTYSDIEVWVAMIKALHSRVFPELKGKWLFVRARFAEFNQRSSATKRSVVIAASFNDKLTRNETYLNGVKVGEIFFSIT